MRIISLVPSLSETLVDLGLRSSLVGSTQFCTEPKDLHRTAQVVGGTKDFSLERIAELSPTHILANQEENPKELVIALQERYPLLLTFPKSPFDVPSMLRDMESFLGGSFSDAIDGVTAALKTIQPLTRPKSFLYFIWREPYMVVGRDTYISQFLEAFGFQNAMRGDIRYPSVTEHVMNELKPDICFFSTEPYPFRQRDAERLRAAWKGCPEIIKIDGRLMSWYGTMTKDGIAMLNDYMRDNKRLTRL